MLRDALMERFPALRQLPPNAEVVGGAVRDLLLGVEPADVDVECEDPLACAAALGTIINLGRGDFQVYRIVIDGRVYDFSRRTDPGRRDFSMNAIAVDLATGALRDPFDGQEDVRRRVVRMIHPRNFQDDPLRMLRGVRLAVQFGFTIDGPTVAAIRRRAGRIVTVAAERVTYELNAIFSFRTFRSAVRLLHETALDEPLVGYAIDPERYQADDMTLAGAYALLLRDPRAFAERWKWSARLLREVLTLQRLAHDASAIALYDAGEDVARQLPPLLRALGRDEVAVPDVFATRPFLDGNEIAALAGIPPGPQLGATKRALLEAQLSGKVKNRQEAEQFVHNYSK